jgi:hypothetical protein
MSDDAAGFSVKVVGLRYVVGRFATDLPSRREVEIQVDTLGRMGGAVRHEVLGKRDRRDAGKDASSEAGADMHRLARQSKVVDKLVTKLFEEWLVREVPGPTSKKQSIKRFAAHMTRFFSAKFHKTTLQVRADAAPYGRIALPDVAGFKRLLKEAPRYLGVRPRYASSALVIGRAKLAFRKWGSEVADWWSGAVNFLCARFG